MTVPNYRHVPQKLYATGLYDLRSEEGQGAFVDAVVSTLNGIDPNFRHLKKKPGQSQLHHHGEDSVIYLLPDNKAQAVDFIGGAGGANPQPGWIVDEPPRYTHADAHAPDDHGIEDTAPPPPTYPPYPGDAVFDQVGVVLFSDYAQANQSPNPQMGRWFGRTNYDWIAQVTPTLEASIEKHRKEWRAILGLPPL